MYLSVGPGLSRDIYTGKERSRAVGYLKQPTAWAKL